MKRTLFIFSAACVIACFTTVPAEASAQEGEAEVSGEGGAPGMDEAKVHFVKGVEFFSKENWEKALKEFQKSFNLKPHWKIRYNIGLCYLKLEFWAQAMTEMTLMIEEGGENVPTKQAGKVNSMIESVRTKVGALTLEGDVENVDVFVDGKPIIGLAQGGVLFLNPGEHRVEVRAGSITIISEDVVLTGEQEKVLEVKLPEEMGETGEGQTTTTTEETPVELPLPTPPPKKSRTTIIAGSVLAALAGAALIGGGGAGINAILEQGKMRDARDAYESGQETDLAKTNDLIDEHYDKAYTSATASTILFSLGGGLAAASLIVFLIPRMKKEKKHAVSHLESVDLLPGPASLVLSFSF